MTTDQAELIDELREFLGDQADADFPDGASGFVPNAAMRLLMRLNEHFPEEK